MPDPNRTSPPDGNELDLWSQLLFSSPPQVNANSNNNNDPSNQRNSLYSASLGNANNSRRNDPPGTTSELTNQELLLEPLPVQLTRGNSNSPALSDSAMMPPPAPASAALAPATNNFLYSSDRVAPHPGAPLVSSSSGLARTTTTTYTPVPRPAAPPVRFVTERAHFLIFVKILFQCLERAEQLQPPQLRQRAKAIVLECTRRNRLGDARFTPLQDVVERRLRKTVGDRVWQRALLGTRHYCRTQRIRLCGSTTTTTTTTCAPV